MEVKACLDLAGAGDIKAFRVGAYVNVQAELNQPGQCRCYFIQGSTAKGQETRKKLWGISAPCDNNSDATNYNKGVTRVG